MEEDMSRPSAAEIDRFLNEYSWEPDAVVEQIEIRNSEDSSFQFLMFAVHEPVRGEISLLCLWPKENAPASEWST
jgi:hypothetical protein